jgi:ribosomal protein S18 acetylase RimI-like enzyme
VYPDLRIAEDPANGALIGVCATHARTIGEDPDAAYVLVIGVNAPFRGFRTAAGIGMGDVLLLDALAQIRERWGGDVMPPVWALIAPENARSHALFERHGFEHIAGADGGYDFRYLRRESP